MIKRRLSPGHLGFLLVSSTFAAVDTAIREFFIIPVFPLDFREYLAFQGIEITDDPVDLSSPQSMSPTPMQYQQERDGLQEFVGESGEKVKEMIVLTKDTEDIIDDITLIPLWKWLLREKQRPIFKQETRFPS